MIVQVGAFVDLPNPVPALAPQVTDNTLLTDPATISDETKERLAPLMKKYLP